MSVSHLYKDFSVKVDQTDSASRDEVKIEEDKLRSFEDGYKSGWDDAVKAQEETNLSVGSQFAQNLQETSFGYHEARGALAKELRNVLEPVFEALVPEVARETFTIKIMEKVEALSKEFCERPIEIHCPPNRSVALQNLCDDALKEPFKIVPDGSVEGEQVFIRLGDVERELDLDVWAHDVKELLKTFYSSLDKESSHE